MVMTVVLSQLQVDASQAADEGGNTAEAGQGQRQGDDVFSIVHRKPGGSKGVLLQIKPLTGNDVRHSVQRRAVQCGVLLGVTAQLASHTAEEALK
jgi:hypothetical protein